MATAVPLGARPNVIENFGRPGPSRWPIEIVAPVAFAIAVLAIGAAAALVWQSLNTYRESSRLVARTHQVLDTLERVFSALNEATGQIREYIITENADLLQKRDLAVTKLHRTLEELEALTLRNPIQRPRVADLKALMAQRIEVLNKLQQTHERAGLQAARAFIQTGVAMNQTNQIRSKLDELGATEAELLVKRSKLDAENNRRLTLSALGLMTLVGLTLIVAFHRMWAELMTRRTLTTQLEESRHFFQSVFEKIPNMVFIKSVHDWRYVAFNAAGEELMKNSRTNVIGKTDFDLMPEKLAAELAQRDRDILRDGGAVDIPQEISLSPGGEERVMHTRRALISNTDGEPVYLIGISEDVTDRVRSEQRIRALNEDLQSKADALEAANKELESFCYSVSHDLRAPLRAVNSYALMLEEDHAPHLNDEARRFIKTIRDGANRMGRLIEDLLGFSRLGRTPIRRERLDSAALVARATREVLESFDGAAPKITVHELPTAQGDAALLYQVWTNLIGNAVKYSSKVAAAQIEIGGSSNGAEATFYVKDNGAGFDMQYVSKLFGVFQRLHGVDEFPGTGVGLAIVHRVITRHGGRVWAESAPGEGATFSFTLAIGDAP